MNNLSNFVFLENYSHEILLGESFGLPGPFPGSGLLSNADMF